MPTCPVCRGQYTLPELDCPSYELAPGDTEESLWGQICCCPRCRTDIYGWRQKEKGIEKIQRVLKGLCIFLIPVLAIVLAMFDLHPHWLGSVAAIIFSAAVFWGLKDKTRAFRIDKWARQFKARPGLSLEAIQGVGFAVALAMGLVTIVLMVYWILPPSDPEFWKELVTSLPYGLSFIFLAVALAGVIVEGEIRRLDKVMPQPIFTHTARLLDIVMRSARAQLDLEGDSTTEDVRRTEDAGIQVVLSVKRKVTTTERKGEAIVSLKSAAEKRETSRQEEVKITEKDEVGSTGRWEVKADMWGRIRSIAVRDWWTFVEGRDG